MEPVVTTIPDDCTANPAADDGTCTGTSLLGDGGDDGDGHWSPYSTSICKQNIGTVRYNVFSLSSRVFRTLVFVVKINRERYTR